MICLLDDYVFVRVSGCGCARDIVTVCDWCMLMFDCPPYDWLVVLIETVCGWMCFMWSGCMV